MEQLLDDYKRRLRTITELLVSYTDKESVKDRRYYRLLTKRACYQTFITELKREMLNEEERRADA